MTPEQAWQELLEKDDRTSPAETPEMCLITFGELRDFMQAAEQRERQALTAADRGPSRSFPAV